MSRSSGRAAVTVGIPSTPLPIHGRSMYIPSVALGSFEQRVAPTENPTQLGARASFATALTASIAA